MTPEPERLLTTTQAAAYLGVNPKTVVRWDVTGKFPPGTVLRTLGGHRRLRESAIEQLLRGEPL